jgi:hypothetical protein
MDLLVNIGDGVLTLVIEGGNYSRNGVHTQ